MGPYPIGVDHMLVDSMIALAFLAFGALKGYHAVWVTTGSHGHAQTTRYAFVVVGQAVIAFFIMWQLSFGDWSDFFKSIHAWQDIGGIFGWIVVIGCWVAVFLPVLTIPTLFWIHHTSARSRLAEGNR